MRKQAGNPVFKELAPLFPKMRWFTARAEIRRAFLSTALAVRLDGPDALKIHPDPLVGGPFEYAAFKGGFELRSKFKLSEALRSELKVDERSAQPQTLTVGLRGELSLAANSSRSESNRVRRTRRAEVSAGRSSLSRTPRSRTFTSTIGSPEASTRTAGSGSRTSRPAGTPAHRHDRRPPFGGSARADP